MFYLAPYYGTHSEHLKHIHLFWRSVNQSIHLSVRDSHTVDPVRHYCFGTSQHFTEVTRSEIADISVAMQIAREAFLQNGFLHTSLTACDTELRSVLARIDIHRGPAYFPYEVSEVAQAVLDEVKHGNLVFVPTNEDLRICVKAIQEDRKKRHASDAQQPRSANPYATIEQMIGEPLRMPQNLDTLSPLDDVQPFKYHPGMPDGEVFDLAKTPNAGEPGSWYTNSGSGQMRLYGDGGQPVVDLDFEHDHGQGVPHAHNWSIDPLTGKNSRGSGVPFSILP
ncbi:hypothetical protein [Caballeronia calidae]|nr:hypothetical protein [Caballeronia calidae]